MYKFQDAPVTDTVADETVVAEEPSQLLNTAFTLGWAIIPILDLTAGYFNKSEWTDEDSTSPQVDQDTLSRTWKIEMGGAALSLLFWGPGVFLNKPMFENLFTISSRAQILFSCFEIWLQWNLMQDSIYYFDTPAFQKKIYALHLTALFLALQAPIRIANFYEHRANKVEEEPVVEEPVVEEPVDETPADDYATAL